MGLRLRKRVNLGAGFRVNLSKTGLGYSWGTKGYRVTQTAHGNMRQTFSIPGTGIAYVTETSKKRQANNSQNQNGTIVSGNEAANIENNVLLGTESEVCQSSQAEVIEKINASAQKFNTIWLFAVAFFALLFIHPLFVLSFLLLIPISKYNSAKKVVDIGYDLDEQSEKMYDEFIKSFMNISNSHKLWFVNHSMSLTQG